MPLPVGCQPGAVRGEDSLLRGEAGRPAPRGRLPRRNVGSTRRSASGYLVDRAGIPLEIGCWEANKAETLAIVPIVRQFQERHNIAGVVVVAEAGMLPSTTPREFHDPGGRFIDTIIPRNHSGTARRNQ